MYLIKIGGEMCGADGNCPALYATDEPGLYVAQGKVLPPTAAAPSTSLPPDEIMVVLPESVLRQAFRSLRWTQ